jgi:hypothetical protein
MEKKKMKKVYLIATIALALLSLGQTSYGYILESCDTWASVYDSAGYWIGNDFWNNQGGTQCIWVNSHSDWGITSNQPLGDGNVKAYAHAGFDINKNISQFSSLTSSFSCSVPGSGNYNASYDIWVPSEVMIWFVNQGNCNPIAGSYDASGRAIPDVTNLTLGGHTWNVYHGGSNVITFMRTSNTTSGSVDILALLNWAKNTKGWIGDGNVKDVEFGWEVFNTNGQTMSFTCTGFNVAYSTGGSTTTTTAASTTTTTAGTTTTTAGTCTVTPYVQVNGGAWQQTTNVTVSSGATVKFGPQPASGGTWSWSGCGTSGSSREQTVYPTSSCSATATFSPSGGGSCSATFNVTVSGGSTTTTAASTTTTAGSTTTTASGSCTCTSGCNGTAISPNFTKDGAGQFCWTATSGTYINSWGLNKLNVNGTNYTNAYVTTSSFPAKINGVWYIYYDGSNSWGHFELKN